MHKSICFSFLLTTSIVLQSQIPLESEIGLPLLKSAHGLLDLGIFSEYGTDKQLQLAKIEVHIKPSYNSKTMLILHTISQLEIKEMPTLGKALSVTYGQQNGWHKVKTYNGYGWISSKYIIQFIPTERAIKVGCFTEEWDGYLNTSPSISSSRFKPKWLRNDFPNLQTHETPSLTVTNTKWVGSELWFNVLLCEVIPCSSGVKCLEEKTSGWVLAFGKSNRLIVWEFDC